MTKIAMVVAEYNSHLTKKMKEYAVQEITKSQVTLVQSLEVPGVLDMPLAVKQLLEDPLVQGVFVLGIVMKGDTEHDRLVANTSVSAMIDLSLKYNKPVSYGIIGPGATQKLAEERIQTYAKHAVSTCLTMISLTKKSL